MLTGQLVPVNWYDDSQLTSIHRLPSTPNGADLEFLDRSNHLINCLRLAFGAKRRNIRPHLLGGNINPKCMSLGRLESLSPELTGTTNLVANQLTTS